ncbi:dehydrogenase red2 [Acrodontium crateriforme]|uniref:Short-chain dehydrogenase/reductase 3 n=1 Tax=Acrodontium crateriforme TaxID=150365 RepID=A0AAQ3M205_9PEZI|nr:dehydrogenase red2 [Acrodontium crateriforme]
MSTSIASVALRPAITGLVIFAATLAPEQFRGPLLAKLREYASDRTIENAITALKFFFGFGVVRTVNAILNRFAANDFRLRSLKSQYNWPREIAFITGGTGGFGSRMSKDLAKKGVTVIAVDVRDSLPKDMENNSNIHYYKCDITDRAAVMDLAKTVRGEHGDPTILINNAGLAFPGSIIEHDEKNLHDIFNVNIISHYWTLAAFLPAMIKANKGHVVTIASVASFVSPPDMVSYANTKCALVSLHEGLTAELRGMHKAPNVLTTIVHPTFASTPMVTPFASEISQRKMAIIKPEQVTDAIHQQIIECRRGQLIVDPGPGALLATVRAWPTWMSSAFGRVLASIHTDSIVRQKSAQ